MGTTLRLDDRIEGCLIGAAIGAELGFARCIEPRRFEADSPEKVFDANLAPALDYKPDPHRTLLASAVALTDVAVRAYLESRGRVTPEQFAKLFRDDRGVAFPAFLWDGLHTVQEILKEGMNPRLSGLATFPSGLLCACMPAVGIYHFGHPEYAYLDGVELASVAQPRLGADWAGLCAAAIAAAFEGSADAQAVVNTVLGIAFRNNRPLFYEIDWALRRWASLSGDQFLKRWHERGGAPDLDKDTQWIVYNPIQFVLPLLLRYADDVQKMMALLVVPPHFWYTTTVSAVVGGAILGAMKGRHGLPQEWLEWAEPIARPWFGLAHVVGSRVRREARLIKFTERLGASREDGGSLLKDKVCGCIMAGAIGNAMGSPVEGMTYEEIDRKYPGGITTVLDPKRLEGEDDNQMAMLLVETYLAREGQPVMARHFGKTWQERLNRNHFYPFCMGNAYDLICQGWDARIVGHWSVVTGSTVMCMEPVGIYHIGDPEFAAIDATAIAYMYQRGLDIVAASMLAATVAEAFRPDSSVDSVCKAALAAAPRERLRTFDDRPFKSCHDYIQTCLEVADRYTDVLAARAELYEKCLLYHHIDPLELWGLALAMFKIARGDVRQAAIGGTNIGRDSDTIAGRAAMLSGTLRGAANVPAEWVGLFPREAVDRIYRNAERLAQLVAGGKLPMLRKRQAIAA
jgi:ADP-ribosylglycohydrolase